MPTHLMLDLGSGLLLAASPWLFGFADGTATTDGVWVPHLVLGLVEVLASLTPQQVPSGRGVATTVRTRA